MRYFSVKNFERFQHYKSGAKAEGKPRWIKLYLSVLTDYDLSQLPDSAKAHLYNIWALAADLNNKIPWDAKWLAHKINASSPINLELLEESGFITPLEGFSNTGIEGSDECPSSLVSSLLISSSEENKNPKDAEEDPNAPPTPDELMVGWNTICVPRGLSAVRDLSKSRREKIALRLKERPARDFWQGVIDRICGSAFLRGTNDRGWKVNFDWLFENDTNALKVYEGRYDADKGIQGTNINGNRRGAAVDMFGMSQKPERSP